MDTMKRLPPPRVVGVAVKLSSADAADVGARILAGLARRGIVAVVDRESAAVLAVEAGPAREELGRHADVVLVAGGDGTFLSAARGCPSTTPVAGINMGTLGFLTEHPATRVDELLDEIAAGRALVEFRERLRVTIGADGAGPPSEVLNDAVINKAALARILTIVVSVGGEPLNRFRADGLILASPTGSTAYNLSAGGPLVHPGLLALLVTPICPHMLSNRPLVLPLDRRVEMWVESGDEGVFVTLDGQFGQPLEPGVRIGVERSPQPLAVIREPAGSFFGTLRQKFKWGELEG